MATRAPSAGALDPVAERADRCRRARGRAPRAGCGAMYQSVTSEPQTPHARTSQTTSPAPGLGIGRLLDPDVARGERPRDPHRGASGRDATPRRDRLDRRRAPSTSALTSDAGRDVEGRVTTRRARAGVEALPRPAVRTSSESRSSIAISRAGRAWPRSIVDVGPATTNGMPAARAASASPYVPTLLATSPLAATRSQPTITASTAPAGDQPRRGRVDDQLVRDVQAGELVGRRAAPPGAAAATRWRARSRACRARPARRSPRAPSRGRARRARPCCSGS